MSGTAPTPEQAEFSAAVEPHERALRAYLYRLCGSPDDVDDLYQDVVLRAFEQRRSFRGEASFRTWLFRIASNRTIDYFRARKRWEPEAQDRARAAAIADPEFRPAVRALVESTPQSEFEMREHVSHCFTCVAKTLPPEEQMALLLREVYDFSDQDGAAVLGKSLPAFKHLVHDARATMTGVFDARCALINKQGVCHQCRELNGLFRDEHDAPPPLDGKSLDARLTLVKSIDPLSAKGTQLHAFLLRHLRTANRYD